MLSLRIADHVEVSPPAPTDGAHVWRDVGSAIIAWGDSAGGEHRMHWPGLATFRFSPATDEITAVLAPGARADIVRDTWLRSVVPMALQALGREALHASAVVAPSGVVAFCAQSQTGKSTLAFGLALRGYPQWADDAVVLDGIDALPLPFSVRLRAPSAQHYGDSHERCREVTPDGGPRRLAAVFVLERRGDAAEGVAAIERLKASSPLVALLTHAYCFNPRDTRRHAAMLEHYLEIAARVPVLRLVLPDGLARMPSVLDDVERAIASLPASPPRSAQ